MHLVSKKSVTKLAFIGYGANLPHERHGSPRQTLTAALRQLTSDDFAFVAQSAWYQSAPVPISDQPWYINGVAKVATHLDAETLLDLLHRTESEFGRTRSVPNAARPIDLDLLDFDGQIVPGPGLVLPHPRLHLRAFVLLPLREIAPDWKHPVTGDSIDRLIDALEPGQDTHRIDDDGGDR